MKIDLLSTFVNTFKNFARHHNTNTDTLFISIPSTQFRIVVTTIPLRMMPVWMKMSWSKVYKNISITWSVFIRLILVICVFCRLIFWWEMWDCCNMTTTNCFYGPINLIVSVLKLISMGSGWWWWALAQQLRTENDD